MIEFSLASENNKQPSFSPAGGNPDAALAAAGGEAAGILSHTTAQQY